MKVRARLSALMALLALLSAFVVIPASSASADGCRSVLGNAATFSRYGNQIGVFYIAWDSCAKQVYGEIRFDSTSLSTGWDWNSQIYVNHDGDNSQGNMINGGGNQFWHSPLISIYTPPSSDRAYYAGFQLWNGGQEACWGWAGWDFSGHQLEQTYASCDNP